MDRKTLIDVFPNWTTSGIFASIATFNPPWVNTINASELDLEYFGNVSGDKYISPLITKLMSGDTLSQTEITLLATSIVAINGFKWEKEWNTLNLSYNPIENYSMMETMTNDETVIEYGKTSTRTDNLTSSKTGTETQTPDLTTTRTDNLTNTETPDVTNTVNESVYGFNESSSTPSNDVLKTFTGETVTTNTGTETTETGGTSETEYDLTDSNTGTQSYVDTGEDVTTHNYTLSRAGNIGVTTSQQMIESERSLWMWNFFHDVVFPDINRVLTIQIY